VNGMLWFSGAVERDPSIDVWLNEQAPELGAIARKWFVQMRECGDDVRELMHDGCPVACVGDAPFGYVNSLKLTSTLDSSLAQNWKIPRACWKEVVGACVM